MVVVTLTYDGSGVIRNLIWQVLILVLLGLKLGRTCRRCWHRKGSVYGNQRKLEKEEKEKRGNEERGEVGFKIPNFGGGLYWIECATALLALPGSVPRDEDRLL